LDTLLHRINATDELHSQGYRMCRGYIATQDPLPALLMISGGWFGNRVHTTVMLTQVVQRGKG